jgi:polygalacturonase
MNTFDSARRDLLRLSSMGLAASAVSAIPALAVQPTAHARHSVTHPVSPTLFDVRTFGATGDGKTVDSPAINKAIEAAAAAGGGTVIFPGGNYISFSIRLKSNVSLHLMQGATIIAADSPQPKETTGYMSGTYDLASPKTAYEDYQDYGHNHWQNSLIWGEDVSDVSITGPGLIWGKGLSYGQGPGHDGKGRGGYTYFKAEQAGVGNKAIGLKNCRNIILRDFSILKGGHFGLLLTGVDNLTIDNLKLDTDRDGMDIDCCKNVRVSNCTVSSPDDAICMKSSFALGYARSTDNVTITNCYVTGAYLLGSVLDGTWKKPGPGQGGGRNGRIKCGTESNGGFRNITISNCLFEGCHGLALESVDGALMEDIAVTNITMRDIISCPIYVRLGARLRGPKGSVPGTAQRILLSNISCYNSAAKFGSNISGIPGYTVKDIKISDIYVQNVGGGTEADTKIVVPDKINSYPEPESLGRLPAYGFYFRHVDRLEMSHVEVHPDAPDARFCIYTDDVHRADFIAITAQSSPQAFSFNNSTDIRVRLSRAAEDSTLP